MDQTITIVVPINVRRECSEQLKSRINELVVKTRQEAGNVFYIPHEATDGSGRFVIYERWADQSALDFHMGQPYLQQFLVDSEDWLATPISGIFCRELIPVPLEM